jgi:uncharacterized DUF497 family protein
MNVEFDAAKDVANLEKHGLSLSFGARIFDDPDVLVLPTIRQGDEEERYKAVGVIQAGSIPPSMFGGVGLCGSFR